MVKMARQLVPPATCQPFSRPPSALTLLPKSTLVGTRTIVNHTPSLPLPVSRLQPSPGVLVVPSLVFHVFVVVVLHALAQPPLATCAAVVACSTQTRHGAVGTARSTSPKDVTPLSQPLPPLLSQLWPWLRVIVLSLFPSSHWFWMIPSSH